MANRLNSNTSQLGDAPDRGLNGGKLTKIKIRDIVVPYPQSVPRNISTQTRDYYLYQCPQLWREDLPVHLLFEFASGYALFNAHGLTEVETSSFESAEKYINRSDQPVVLEAFYLFSSSDEALVQMNAIFNSIVTEQLKKLLEDSLPKPIIGKQSYYVATSDPMLGNNILSATGMSIQKSILINNVMRLLRMKIDKFIGLEPGHLEKAQLNLGRLYNNQICTKMGIKSSMPVSSSFLVQDVEVVPHHFEGVFVAKGTKDFLCTKNLVPGEVLYGEEFIRIQDEDRTEVEYREWNPLRSKLGAAILCGVTNIWIKPGSRVLYMGNVCGITVSHLSDLVGSDGLVYVVGFSDVVVNMAGKRSNVLTIFEKSYSHWNYRMLVGMVDVIFAEIDNHSQQVNFIANNAGFYLRAGGHYMISTQANGIDSSGQVKDPFADHHLRREFKPIEIVMLESMDGAYALAVGGFRMPEE